MRLVQLKDNNGENMHLSQNSQTTKQEEKNHSISLNVKWANMQFALLNFTDLCFDLKDDWTLLNHNFLWNLNPQISLPKTMNVQAWPQNNKANEIWTSWMHNQTVVHHKQIITNRYISICTQEQACYTLQQQNLGNRFCKYFKNTWKIYPL